MARLRETFDLVELAPGAAKDPAAIAAALGRAEGVLVAQAIPFHTGLLDGCPRLRVISKVGVDYDTIDVAAATARHILVCNTPGVLSGAVADHTFARLRHVQGSRAGLRDLRHADDGKGRICVRLNLESGI